MGQKIAALTYMVHDYDEAIAYFTGALRFNLMEDTLLDDGKRWVTVAPHQSQGATLLLAKAATPDQISQIGKQGGGRVFLFLESDDFWDDYRHMQEYGVAFDEKPREEVYGTVAVFCDLYGNKWDLLQRNNIQ